MFLSIHNINLAIQNFIISRVLANILQNQNQILIMLHSDFFYNLGAMQSVMAEEMRREQMRREYEVEKKGVINSAMLL